MRTAVDLNFDPEQPVTYRLTNQTGQPRTDADAANTAFDASMKQFLYHWITQNSPTATTATLETDLDTYIEQGALRAFFEHHDQPLRDLLADPGIARHLLRPVDEVHFENDAYEPMLARFERRIYNLAAHRKPLEIPFRYTPTSRQHDNGDSLSLPDMIQRQGREDIGMYFGTRRSDETALGIIARQLRTEAALGSELPVHIVTEGYMTESLQAIKAQTQALHNAGKSGLHCFLIHRRHAENDRHLGAALLLMNLRQPTLPQRIVFCDTLRPGALPPWWNKFKQKIDLVFPQPDGHAPASDLLEDGGVNLQRLHDGVPVRHQDIDCAFYSASMVRALVQIARATPGLIIYGDTAALVGTMTARMPEYFNRANHPHDPVQVREANVAQRWNTGREALYRIWQTANRPTGTPTNNELRISSTVQELTRMELLPADTDTCQETRRVGRRGVRRLSVRRMDRPRTRRIWRLAARLVKRPA